MARQLQAAVAGAANKLPMTVAGAVSVKIGYRNHCGAHFHCYGVNVPPLLLREKAVGGLVAHYVTLSTG